MLRKFHPAFRCQSQSYCFSLHRWRRQCRSRNSIPSSQFYLFDTKSQICQRALQSVQHMTASNHRSSIIGAKYRRGKKKSRNLRKSTIVCRLCSLYFHFFIFTHCGVCVVFVLWSVLRLMQISAVGDYEVTLGIKCFMSSAFAGESQWRGCCCCWQNHVFSYPQEGGSCCFFSCFLEIVIDTVNSCTIRMNVAIGIILLGRNYFFIFLSTF